MGWINQESCFDPRLDSSSNRPDRFKASLLLNLCQWRLSWGLSNRANKAGQWTAWRADVRNKWVCTSSIPPTFTTCRGTNLVYLFFIVKPTRCTNVSILFYFGITVHVSDGLSVHHQEFRTLHTATGICQTDTALCLLASRQQYLFDIRLLQHVKPWTPDDVRKDRPKHVECYSKIK